MFNLGTGEFIVAVTSLVFSIALPVAVVLGSLLLFARTSIGRAVLDRISGSAFDQEAFATLVDEVQVLRDNIVDMQERLDTAERLLERGREQRT